MTKKRLICPSFTAGTKDLLLFPPAAPHNYSFDSEAGGWEHLWVYFTPPPSMEPLLNWPEGGGGVLKLTITEDGRWSYLVGRLEELISAEGLTIDPDKKAELISIIYEDSMREDVEEEEILPRALRLLRLAT